MHLKILSIFLIGVFMNGCASKDIQYDSKHFKNGTFSNPYKNFELNNSEQFSLMWYFFTDDTPNKIPKDGEIPVVKLTKDDIVNMADNSVVRFGHSSLLIKTDNRYILTDPVFANRTSPVSFAGPKRFHKPPLKVEDLPFIDILIISHNHYDHLDEDALEQMLDKVGHIYTALGLSQKLKNIGFKDSQITELDWWKGKQNDTISITATPAQHFSGRGIFDRNKTFWASWVIRSSTANIYYSADSGYNIDFKTIGERFGPFDITFIETGAYNTRWKVVHMMPDESVQAHIDVKGKIMFPVHNGTFVLSTHPWKEPFELVLKYAKEKNVQVVHPKMGEIIPILEFTNTSKWWE